MYIFNRFRWAAVFSMLILGGCATGGGKPMASAEFLKGAKGGLEGFIQTLPGSGPGARLQEATLFSDGFYHESWRLIYMFNGKRTQVALKIFPDGDSAQKSLKNYAMARAAGWPLPKELYRGKVAPYQNRQGLVMEYIEVPTLAGYSRQRADEGLVDPDGIRVRYEGLGLTLGQVHRAGLRTVRGDKQALKDIDDLLERCEFDFWCGPKSMQRFEELKSKIIKGPITYIHGDLFEAHATVRDDGFVKAFLGMHHGSEGDPARDVGTMLAHTLIINPIARNLIYGIPNSTTEEAKFAAESFLRGYRVGFEQANAVEWEYFMSRAVGYAWLRVGELLMKLQGNPHTEALVRLVNNKKAALFVLDPLKKYGVEWR